MDYKNVVQQIIKKTDQKIKIPKIYKLQWASGQQSILSLTETTDTINRWLNHQKDWQWIKVVNLDMNKQQVIYENESPHRIGKKLELILDKNYGDTKNEKK